MRILLTGAGGRFGTAFMDRFGDDAEIIALRHGSDAQELPDRIVPSTGKVGRAPPTVVCDFASPDDVWRAIGTVTSLLGPIDHVVNAGADTRFLGLSQDIPFFAGDAMRQLVSNTLAPALIASSVFHHCWKQKRPEDASVLNISSISAHRVFSGNGQALYAASKSALNTLTLHMAADFEPYGVRVNALSPDAFPTTIPTAQVVEAATKILRSRQSGHVFQLGPRATPATT